MLKILPVLFAFQINLTLAQSLQDCVDQASWIDPHIGVPNIELNCKNTVINNAFEHAIDYSSDNFIQIFGAGNMLYTLAYKSDELGNPQVVTDGITAGKYTSFTDIRALEIDEHDGKVFVLDEETDGSFSVISVSATASGSLAPSTRLANSEIAMAKNIKTDRGHNELYVVGENWIKVFNINAYSGSFRADQSDQLIRKIEGNNTQLGNVADLAISPDFIFVLDSDRILKFPRTYSHEDQTPLAISDGLDLNNAKSIDLLENQLVVTNGDDSQVTVNL